MLSQVWQNIYHMLLLLLQVDIMLSQKCAKYMLHIIIVIASCQYLFSLVLYLGTLL